MASRILGMGDVVSLVERAAETVDLDEAKRMEEKMRKGQFSLEDFLDQMRAMKKLGSLQSIVGMLPGGDQITSEQLDEQQKEFKRMEGIICAMTPKERQNPNLLNAKRRLRIASRQRSESGRSEHPHEQIRADAADDEKIRQDAEDDGPHGRENAGHEMITTRAWQTEFTGLNRISPLLFS
jgi:signal recognition particle GTPase